MNDIWFFIFASVTVRIIIDIFRSCNGDNDTLGYRIYLGFIRGYRSTSVK